MNNKALIITVIACTLIVFGVVVRLLPHAPNMTPVTALALVGGLYLGGRWALALPLAVLVVSDAILGVYDWRIMASVYGSFALIGILSMAVSKQRTMLSVGLSLIGSSLLFFLITNGAVWAFSPWYEKTVSGLLYAYELGLPFLRNMIIGDVLYTVSLVVLFESVFALGTVLRTRKSRGCAQFFKKA